MILKKPTITLIISRFFLQPRNLQYGIIEKLTTARKRIKNVKRTKL